MSRKEVRPPLLLRHRKSYPRLSGSTIFMLIIRDRNDTFGLRALDGSLGFLLGALEALFATDEVLRGVPKRFSNNIRISNVDFSKMLLFSNDSCYF